MSRALTARMLDRLDDRFRGRGQQAQALHYAAGALVAYDTQRHGKVTELPDVERLASAIELLAQREHLEVSPFVAAWQEAVTRLDTVTTASPHVSAQGLKTGVARALNSRSGGDSDLGRVLRPFVESVVRPMLKPEGGVFTALLNQMLEELVDILGIPPGASLDYLDPIFDLHHIQGDLVVATLNYDLVLERRAAALGVEVDRGLDEWHASSQIGFRDGSLRLLKLHGSLDWRLSQMKRAGQEWMLPSETVVPAETRIGSDRLGIVFGQRGKLRAAGPFLALLAAFEDSLRGADELVVVGYSFRDDHVNEIVSRWANADRSRTMVIVDPQFRDDFGSAGWWGDRSFSGQLISSMWWNGDGQRTSAEGQPRDPDNPRLRVYREPAESCLASVLV